ncbi:class I adenylate-forming enzyme family protein [Yinghuangia sp. YIM S10712]|uniref:class I adenylate-forming enzyme family protein n=1 Tax=Yinghuangia sp. YIM S10712 TaxID=3436930 RepID=UPI003F531BD6
MLEIDTSTRLWDLAEQRAARDGSAEMLVDERGRRLTFAEFRDHSERMAETLSARGVGPGTPVTWRLPTVVEALVVTCALARLGAVQNPVMPICGERELRFILARTGAELFITAEGQLGLDEAWRTDRLITDRPGLDALVVAAEGQPRRRTAPNSAGPDDDVRWIFFTSGTTADPKGARHTDASVLAAAQSMAVRLDCTKADRVGLAFPIAHIGGCGIWLGAALICGCTLVLDAAFEPERTSRFFHAEEVTLAGSGAVFIQAYLELQRRQPDTPLFPKLRAMTAGGSARPITLHADTKRAFGVPVLSGYGMTEAPVLAMAGPHDPDDTLHATEGRPKPDVHLRIVAPDGRVLGAGEEGEIRAKGPQVMRGYLDASLTRDVFDEDGYLRTGDLGMLDERGYLTVTGRLKDIIIRKGENISARALEDALASHQAVADVAVVGLPDAGRGELACAVVVPRGNAPTLADLTAFLADQGLPPRQWPERLETVDTLPRNATGKVLKTELRERYTT